MLSIPSTPELFSSMALATLSPWKAALFHEGYHENPDSGQLSAQRDPTGQEMRDALTLGRFATADCGTRH
jgi:hypothetical protein